MTYVPSGNPTTGSAALSAVIRAEFQAVAAGINDSFPVFTGNPNRGVVVNGAGTGFAFTTGAFALAGDFATAGAYSVTLTFTGATGVTFPTAGTLATLAGTETLTNKTLVAPALGTPASGNLSNCTGIPIGAGNVSNTGTPTSGQIAEWTSATVVQGVSTTGSGPYVRATSPTLTTPVLGTVAAGSVLTNATGLPISTGLTGAGTGVLTALAINVGSAGAPVVFNGALGTPSSGTATNLTGTATGLTAGNATTAVNLNGGTVSATTVVASGVASLNGGISVNGPTITSGTGSPEGAVTASVGSVFLRTNGGAVTTLYIKESGAGNTGWVAK